jgi:hypothetical protein
VKVRQAEVLADFEQQLASRYEAQHEAWREVVEEARAMVAEADAKIAERCDELGIRPEFRPGLSLGWYGRGENSMAQRRTELRKVAVTRIDALGKAARLAIERQELDALTAIATAGLSAEAHAYLDTLPTAEQLMPTLALHELEEALT